MDSHRDVVRCARSAWRTTPGGSGRTPNGNIRHGLGLLHIVFARMAKVGASLDDAVQTAIEVADAAGSGMPTRDEKNSLWLDRNGVRAAVAKNADGKKVITGYEIYADEPKVTNRASFGSDNLPTPRSEDILSALKSRLASLPEATPRNIPYPAPGAQGGVESGTNRHGERYSVRAVGKYAGELRRLGLRALGLLHDSEGEGHRLRGLSAVVVDAVASILG